MKNAASFMRVIKRIRPYYGLLLLALLFAVLSVSLTLLIPVLVGRAIDNIIADGQVYFEAVLQIIALIAIALVGVSVFLSFIAGLLPSRKAAKADPVEALRSE